MLRKIATATLFAIATAAVTGCGNNAYQPPASDTELSSYAGKAEYPSQLHSEEAAHIFAGLSADNTITIHNLGETLSGFDLWVNKTYVLHVSKLDSRSKAVYSPNTLYNRTGTNLAAAGSTPISYIQIRTTVPDKLWDVQGPEHE